MKNEVVLRPNLEFHFFKTYADYEAFIHACNKRCCKLMNMDLFTDRLRELAGVERNEYPYVVAVNKQKRRKKE